MNPYAALVAEMACFLMGALWVFWMTRKEIQYLRDELTTAQDRLLGAWKEGAVIPTKEQVSPVPKQVIDPLPQDYRQLVGEYSSAEAQSDVEEFIRQKRNLGWGIERIREAMDQSVG